ncbi:MAG: glycosyltransferase [Vicinamibacterales bacterium]
MTPVRLTVVLTHPIQYYAPWFRHIVARAPGLALTVLHATEPTPAQQGVGFARPITWDVPLTEGYESETVRSSKPDDQIDSSHFFGLDVPEIADAIAHTRPDVVLITGWYSITLVRALHACRRLGVPVLYRGDSHLLSAPRGWRHAIWQVKTWFLLRQFSGFLSPGRRVDGYLRWFGVPEYRIFQVPHGVDNDLFARTAAPYLDPVRRAEARRAWGIAEDAFVVLFVGKLVPSKRPLNVVRAMAQLPRGATLMIVGSGPLEDRLCVEAARVGVDLKLVGFLNQSELGRAYAVADCLTLPSDFPETWGLVINEALATGLPVVVSHAVGCAPDLVRVGETGYSYPLDDVDALADRLATMWRRKTDGHDWRPKCRELVAAYSYDVMTAGLVRACRSVLRHSVGPEPAWDEHAQRIVVCCGLMVIAAGLERMTFQVIRALGQRGMAVHCIVNSWENFRITPLAEASGASWSVGPYWYPLTRRHVTPVTIGKMCVEVWRVSADLLRVSRRVRPTHVFLPDFQAVLRNVPALVWLRARGVRVIVRLGNAPATGPFYRWLWRRAINPFVDLFVANSGFTRDALLGHGVPASKVDTIQNTAGSRREAWDAHQPRIPGRVIYVGQVIPDKGLDLLLEAVAILRGRGLQVSLDVIGDMDGWEAPEYRGYRARVRDRAARADLQGSVQFLGWREDVPVLMSRASLHCCPSRAELREGFGVVVLEAKLSGLPSVVTPSGNLPELVTHRETGWVCAEASAPAVAEGLQFFLESPERLSAAGAAAARSSDAFSGERFGDAWCQVFSEARMIPNAPVVL